MLIATVFIIVETWKQPECPLTVNGPRRPGMRTQGLLSHRNEGVLPPTATWMRITGIKLNEINQRANDKVYAVTNMRNLKQT